MTVFEEDIENIIKDFDMSVFDGKTVLVTGATVHLYETSKRV